MKNTKKLLIGLSVGANILLCAGLILVCVLSSRQKEEPTTQLSAVEQPSRLLLGIPTLERAEETTQAEIAASERKLVSFTFDATDPLPNTVGVYYNKENPLLPEMEDVLEYVETLFMVDMKYTYHEYLEKGVPINCVGADYENGVWRVTIGRPVWTQTSGWSAGDGITYWISMYDGTVFYSAYSHDRITLDGEFRSKTENQEVYLPLEKNEQHP